MVFFLGSMRAFRLRFRSQTHNKIRLGIPEMFIKRLIKIHSHVKDQGASQGKREPSFAEAGGARERKGVGGKERKKRKEK